MDEDAMLESILFPWLDSDCMGDAVHSSGDAFYDYCGEEEEEEEDSDEDDEKNSDEEEYEDEFGWG